MSFRLGEEGPSRIGYPRTSPLVQSDPLITDTRLRGRFLGNRTAAAEFSRGDEESYFSCALTRLTSAKKRGALVVVVGCQFCFFARTPLHMPKNQLPALNAMERIVPEIVPCPGNGRNLF